ncbi:carbohydrate ABC transporter permease [Aquibacillus rhizosphaerae]|uniref:Carbohydrate ABC transporter permease n=1 Tax=Aquibacillus rhizosphaerae TaxID=3051431 RepID=A0ABT7L0G0_9BACI|nr:carbohydrate ABC transporter permease [Aquibacillus sp. LR5S19]MDL4839249.1 carbohydrate ABC transporter permease [Aquibacillus sp. LR5S19]
MNTRTVWSNTVLSGKYLLLTFLSFLMFFPFLWMVSSALKTKEEIWQFPPTWWPENPQWSNFLEAWEMAPFGLYIFNSVFTATVIVVLQLVTAAMISYAFTQFKFKGRDALFTIILGSYMLPVAATYVPSYVLLADFGLLDTYSGIIVSNAVSVFGIFLLRQAFMQVPKEMVEAARVDGATHWRILWKIFLPLTLPSFVTFGLISFVQMYNNYLWPSLIIKSEEKMLITQGIQKFFMQEGGYGLQWPLIMAASSFVVFPLLILFIFAQKFFVSGINDQGVKG